MESQDAYAGPADSTRQAVTMNSAAGVREKPAYLQPTGPTASTGDGAHGPGSAAAWPLLSLRWQPGPAQPLPTHTCSPKWRVSNNNTIINVHVWASTESQVLHRLTIQWDAWHTMKSPQMSLAYSANDQCVM